jgi:hypothetical protein
MYLASRESVAAVGTLTPDRRRIPNPSLETIWKRLQTPSRDASKSAWLGGWGARKSMSQCSSLPGSHPSLATRFDRKYKHAFQGDMVRNIAHLQCIQRCVTKFMVMALDHMVRNTAHLQCCHIMYTVMVRGVVGKGCHGARFRQKFTLKDAFFASHACSLEALSCVCLMAFLSGVHSSFRLAL